MTATPSRPKATTDDALLGGAVRLLQPARGYRVAIDPVFLAAAVPAGPGGRVLVRGTRGDGSLVRRHAGLVLHEEDGRYTPAAEAVLRGGVRLAF